MRAVPDEHINAMLTQQDQLLDAVVDLDGLERWRDVLISFNRQRDGTFGCVLGAAVPELADRDEQARQKLARYFAHWQSLAANALRRLQSIGKLRDEAKPDALATGLIAALQGGYILAQASRDVDDMAAALDMALDHVRSFAVRP